MTREYESGECQLHCPDYTARHRLQQAPPEPAWDDSARENTLLH